MRWLSFVASFALIVAVSSMAVGCKKAANNNTGGTTTPATWGTLGQPDEVKIKKGKTATLKVTIERKGDKKDDDVTLKVTVPEKWKAEPTEKVLAKDKTSQEFTITAPDDAKSGEATVAATPGDQKKTVKLTVE
jgi:uncharacterized membrane protein